jgi:quinolinate synthase
MAYPHSESFPEDLEGAILELKRERNAVVLAHYYQESEIQDLADFVGDSLALAQAATRVESRTAARRTSSRPSSTSTPVRRCSPTSTAVRR